eukprot:CAMPEP_0183797930 /NCGR_PEP_ID=MMETSP0803_2-20130417/17562_1 /TAXON_ID=195967 /ORGANISM="Crustomastix stigmata, Strain CCMP3273" /LENGTH=84 /DNA_ID=CAMNT_0026042603 /DNA_START=15 /DNA_END=266 /DNA_ORIENTATION=-
MAGEDITLKTRGLGKCKNEAEMDMLIHSIKRELTQKKGGSQPWALDRPGKRMGVIPEPQREPWHGPYTNGQEFAAKKREEQQKI